MKVQIVSDLHMEFFENKTRFCLNKNADLLIIAGDLGNALSRQLEFIKEICKKLPVIFILGNHDPMWSSIKETINFWKSVKIENFYFLNNETIEIKGIHFIGSTLWSDLNKDPANNLFIMKNVADYKTIYKDDDDTKFVSTFDMQKKFEECYNFLNKELSKDYKRKVLITHHLPTYASVSDKYQSSRMNAAFVSDLSNMLLYANNLELCIHGHTHDTFDYMLADVLRVVCNPLGYPSENNNGYSNDLLVEL